jgi:glutathione peroxidase-family protein
MSRGVIGLFVLLLALCRGSIIYEMEAEDLESGLPVPLSFYKGKVMLIVNVASQCGYTDSGYKQLNELHKKYSSRGLAILAFPCNQFGQQEPGTDDEILSFATKTKRVAFDLFKKVEVNGPNAHPLFKHLIGGSSECADNEGGCASWAAQGECTANPDFMHGACRLSCKLCTAPAGAGSPIGWNFEYALHRPPAHMLMHTHTLWVCELTGVFARLAPDAFAQELSRLAHWQARSALPYGGRPDAAEADRPD